MLEKVKEWFNERKCYYELFDKLSTFESLEEGWDGYQGKPISTQILLRSDDLLKQLSKKLSLDVLEGIHIFPTSNGDVQIEYEKDNIYWEIEVKESSYEIFSHVNEIPNEEIITKTIPTVISEISKLFN